MGTKQPKGPDPTLAIKAIGGRRQGAQAVKNGKPVSVVKDNPGGGTLD